MASLTLFSNYPSSLSMMWKSLKLFFFLNVFATLVLMNLFCWAAVKSVELFSLLCAFRYIHQVALLMFGNLIVRTNQTLSQGVIWLKVHRDVVLGKNPSELLRQSRPHMDRQHSGILVFLGFGLLCWFLCILVKAHSGLWHWFSTCFICCCLLCLSPLGWWTRSLSSVVVCGWLLSAPKDGVGGGLSINLHLLFLDLYHSLTRGVDFPSSPLL